ncbi:MAG: biotin--[acetyl-CoA-carboxylase] ligase [Bacteroidota bacterium]
MQDSKVAHLFQELDSTNSEAIRRLQSPPLPPAWTSIQAHYQTAGRGQAGNGWHSSAGKNLLYSVIVYPSGWEVEDIFRLTQVLSLSVAASIQFFLPHAPVRIKWPNDIYLGDQKIAGLLIQNSLLGKKIQWSVMGIGLNVHEDDFPPSLQTRATSLQQHCTATLTVDGCREQLLATLKSNMTRYTKRNSFPLLHEAYHQLLYRRGERHAFQRAENHTPFYATLEGVTSQGLLQLRKANDEIELFNLKSIAFL